MLLEQKSYADENGGDVAADQIQAIGTFTYGADGFFQWECPHCQARHDSRAFAINGVVYTCDKCKKRALLLRSDTRFVTGIVSDYNKRRPATDDVIRRALEHLGQAVVCLGRR